MSPRLPNKRFALLSNVRFMKDGGKLKLLFFFILFDNFLAACFYNCLRMQLRYMKTLLPSQVILFKNFLLFDKSSMVCQCLKIFNSRMVHVKSLPWLGQPTIKNWLLLQWTELLYFLMKLAKSAINLRRNQPIPKYKL